MPKISMFGARKKIAMPEMPVAFCSARRGTSITPITSFTGASRIEPNEREGAGLPIAGGVIRLLQWVNMHGDRLEALPRGGEPVLSVQA